MRTVAALLVLIGLTSCVYGYTTSGNKIIDPNGKPVLLRGICRPSLEWSATGENIGQADFEKMKSWGANVIRLCMNQCFWNANTQNYQTTIDTAVKQIKDLGLGVILDLHWSDKGTGANCGQQNMADSNSVTFWKSVATKYKADPWVIFELYNEPHDVSTAVWKSGGDAGGFNSPGMQGLYNAVRSVNALNAVIINGNNWAYDLSFVPANTITGINIIYGTHPYDFAGKQAADWQGGFGFLAATYPLIATEFGNYNCDAAYYNSFISYANQKDISWTAWGWYPGGCNFPAVISDWTGAPNAPGALIKNALSTGPKVPSGGNTTSTTGAPTTAAPTTRAPTTGSSSTTGTSTGTKITAVVNQGTGTYWIHIDSFSGSNKPVSGCLFKDSQSGAGWVAGFTETWGPGWSWSPNRAIITPISLRLTSADGSTVDLLNVVTSVAGAGNYLSSGNF